VSLEFLKERKKNLGVEPMIEEIMTRIFPN
jgi:hypothetical protein